MPTFLYIDQLQAHVTCRYLHPNTSYATFVMDSSICMGGHFYHHSTMTRTLVAFIHMTMSGGLATDMHDAEAWDLLHRMLFFYHDVFVCGHEPSTATTDMHVPILESFDSLVNLFSLCALVMWSNALSPETYQSAEDVPLDVQKKYGINRMNAYRRRKCAFMKKVAKTVLQWTFDRLWVKRTPGAPERTLYENVFVPFIGTLIVQTLVYFKTARAQRLDTALQFATIDVLERELLDPFHEYDEIAFWVTGHSSMAASSLLYDFGDRISIARRPSARATLGELFCLKLAARLQLLSGYDQALPTPLDRVYLDGLRSHWTADVVSIKVNTKRKRQWDEESDEGEDVTTEAMQQDGSDPSTEETHDSDADGEGSDDPGLD